MQSCQSVDSFTICSRIGNRAGSLPTRCRLVRKNEATKPTPMTKSTMAKTFIAFPTAKLLANHAPRDQANPSPMATRTSTASSRSIATLKKPAVLFSG